MRRYLIVIILLGTFLSFKLFYGSRSNSFSRNINIFELPETIGEWKGVDFPVKSFVLDALRTKSVMLRQYSNKADKEVLLTIVYYQDNRVDLHSPETCAVGQGADVYERKKESIVVGNKQKQIQSNLLLVKNPTGSQVIVYFFESGDYFTGSYFKLRWHMFLRGLKKSFNSGALIKFSTPVSNNKSESLGVMKEFISEGSKLLPKYLP